MCTLAGPPDDGAGVLPADGRMHRARLLGVVRELALDDPPAFRLASLPLNASESDSLNEEAASDSLVRRPRGLETRAGVARTLSLVLAPAWVDSTPLLEDNVIGVADDASGEEADAMMEAGGGQGTLGSASYG